MDIKEITREIREKSIKKSKINDEKNAAELAASWSGEDLLYSGPGRAIFIILPTSGCAWALSESGGCSMCSYISDSPLKPVNAKDLVKIFKDHFNRQIEREPIDGPTVVKIFVSGSFLNPIEVAPEARKEIIDILSHYADIEEVVVESRPEYVTPEVIRECCEGAGDKIFEVAMGLETGDELLRNDIINKGFTNEEFELAVNNIKEYQKSCNVRSKVYLLVKPILTNEKDAVEDAVSSAIYAENVGVDRVSFCPSTIHKGTLMEVLWRRGSYQPPWIWSLLNIISRVRGSLKIPVIMDTSGFGTRRGPFNCKKCNSKFKDLIIKSNLEQVVPEEFECDCKDIWQAEIEYSGLTHSPSNLSRK